MYRRSKRRRGLRELHSAHVAARKIQQAFRNLGLRRAARAELGQLKKDRDERRVIHARATYHQHRRQEKQRDGAARVIQRQFRRHLSSRRSADHGGADRDSERRESGGDGDERLSEEDADAAEDADGAEDEDAGAASHKRSASRADAPASAAAKAPDRETESRAPLRKPSRSEAGARVDPGAPALPSVGSAAAAPGGVVEEADSRAAIHGGGVTLASAPDGFGVTAEKKGEVITGGGGGVGAVQPAAPLADRRPSAATRAAASAAPTPSVSRPPSSAGTGKPAASAGAQAAAASVRLRPLSRAPSVASAAPAAPVPLKTIAGVNESLDNLIDHMRVRVMCTAHLQRTSHMCCSAAFAGCVRAYRAGARGFHGGRPGRSARRTPLFYGGPPRAWRAGRQRGGG